MSIQWCSILQKFQYENVKELLLDMYIRKQMSSSKISKVLGTSSQSVINHLKKQGFNVRFRGGNNNPHGRRGCGKEYCIYE